MTTSSARLRDHAYSSFTDMLLARDIQPGQFVSQRELVQLTGFPLGAIREMIPRLEADGLIRTSPQRGLQVLSIDLDLIRNAFQLRQIIEGEAFGHFCGHASDADLQRIHDEHTAIRAEAVQGVTPDLLERAQHMDWAFHDHVVDHMGNQIISDIHRVNAIKIRLIRNADTRMLPDHVIWVMDMHLSVICALLARDKAATLEAIRAHIESSRQRALGI
ncbi:GntR family transcriptional regulator [Ruegeria sp. 2205SS24-7]|uniref:GntR family transcriptional regulator n=1 Tax=Ruegeria discodermiae TaxID=3064389 RepID=UPI0027403686|nr:GntR family transcriptional regulator [Ruegeria sp. 2205SS24-7]MDP5219038.1 GntR family transcriptional regulator [Ruegeria sp. 2205SS24-7]